MRQRLVVIQIDDPAVVRAVLLFHRQDHIHLETSVHSQGERTSGEFYLEAVDRRMKHLLRIHKAVGKHTQRLATIQTIHNLHDVHAIHSHRDHLDTHVSKLLLSVFHQLLLLAAIHQDITRLGLTEVIAHHLTTADMGIQQHHRLVFAHVRVKVLMTYRVNLEMMTCIHRKLIDHRLSEQTVVAIGAQKCLPTTLSSPFTEILVGDPRTRTEHHRHRDHAHRHKTIDITDVHPA